MSHYYSAWICLRVPQTTIRYKFPSGFPVGKAKSSQQILEYPMMKKSADPVGDPLGVMQVAAFIIIPATHGGGNSWNHGE